MLEDSLFESQGRRKARKPLMVAASVIAHMVTIVVLILIPLIQTQAITIPPINTSLLAPRIEAPKPVEVFSVQPRIQKYTQAEPNILTAPESIPERIAYVDEPTNPSGGLLPSPGLNGLGSLLHDLINAGTEPAAPAEPVPPPTMLNGDRVEVITTVTVTFTLQ